ncbi:Peptidoglycan-associated lipoprotein [Sinobacterium norvegicum]|uniref:Peptidoglycan-associated lipoprotein n=1 Tax=Sinobacterium norvegicum TaxID=1641715 RepID=A0ABM9AJU9_9GAMM|nr:OmpA family protein [Sinobacterium norvegicum]CAH0993404.1 Peptidoglycan-associated lipoprotein [Sinobacterium norvegicum]
MNKFFLSVLLLILTGCAEHVYPPEDNSNNDTEQGVNASANRSINPPYQVGTLLPADAGLKDADKDGVIDARDNCNATIESLKINNDGCALLSNKQKKVIFSAHFNTDDAVISNDDKIALEQLANEFLNSKYQYLLVVGHTDSEGSKESNILLSIDRAVALASVLTQKYYIEEDQILISGLADQLPVASNEDEQGRAENRRADTYLTNQKNLDRFKWDIWSVDQKDIYSNNQPNQTFKILTFEGVDQ